jgi:hypothetical protein
LPVSLPAGVASIPDRLAGWGIASAASVLAIALLWPAPVRNPLRGAAIAACRALAVRLRVEVGYVLGGGSGPSDAERDAAVAAADRAVEGLDAVFFATAHRPSGLSTSARAILCLVDQLRWLNAVIAHAAPRPAGPPTPTPMPTPTPTRACAVKSAAAAVLECSGALLDEPDRRPEPLRSALAHLRDELIELERTTTLALPARAAASSAGDDVGDVISAMDPSFRAQELSFIVSGIAGNADVAAAAERRSWVDQLLGRQPDGPAGPLSAARARAAAHVEPHSLWLHNSLRGAAGLGLAVLVADLTGVQHAFWVVFGTLSVLRSSALNTGQNVVRGLFGTTAGFIVGAVLVTVIGTDTTLLWFLLPPVVLLAGLAPAAFSFAAGQAAFTVTLLILFNILQPAGWRIGLVRIEDVALGSAVSLVVGLLFWPRGAVAALGKALAEAYIDSANYLARAVEFGVDRCDAGAPARPAPTREAARATASSRRLDDTFRTYLAERGTKPGRLADVATLVTGEAGLRLAGDAVLDLWQRDDPDGGNRSGARQELLENTAAMTEWYERFAGSLTGPSPAPEPVIRDRLADGRLIDALRDDLRGADGRAATTAVRVIWTSDHLDAARRLQRSLARPAEAALAPRS